MLKPFLLIATLAATLALGTAASATAASSTACWKVVVSDWFHDGRIDNTYPLHCYEEALQHLPEDVKAYADASDEISRAMQAAIRHDRRDLAVGKGSSSSGSGDKRSGQGPIAFGGGGGGGPSGGDPPKGVVSRWIDWIGPSNAGSVPLPLLVLAGIAMLLLAAAASSFTARRIQARRMVPARASAPNDQTRP